MTNPGTSGTAYPLLATIIPLMDKEKGMGEFEKSVFMGAYQDYHVNVDGVTIQVTDYNPAAKHTFAAGEKVGITFDEAILQLVDR